MDNNTPDAPDGDIFDDDNAEMKDIEKSLTKKQQNQSVFLQFILLFTGTKFNTLLTTSTSQKYRIQKKLSNLFFAVNNFLPESQKLMSSAIENDQVFPSLFESGFFKNLSKYFFHKVMPVTIPIKRPGSMFGCIVGLSLQNKTLIRNSLIKLIGSEIKQTYINGIFGFIVNDPSQEKDMRGIMKKMNLNASLGLSLVELVTEATKRDKYNAALSICKKYCTASRRVSALVAMFKKDLSNIRIISERIDVDTEVMSAILACATNRLDLLKENFKTLSFKLGINNTFALRSLLSIASGDSSQIYRLKDKKNEFFRIKEPDLLDSLVFITREGTKMRDEHTRFDIKDNTFACQTIYDSLKKILGITRSRPIEDEGKDYVERNKSKSMIGTPNDGASDNASESFIDELDFDLKDLLDTDDALLANIQLIINACWDDGKALSILADSIKTREKRDPGSVNEIWSKFPEKGKEIVIKKLRGVYEGAKESLAYMETILARKISENMRYIQALEKGEKMDFSHLEGEDKRVVDQLKDSDQKTAYTIGCTYNITGFREFNQEFMLCETCEYTTGEDVVICLCCAEFCHAGHKLMKGNKGNRSRIVCSCGSNTFPDCPVNDKGNPLLNIKNPDDISPTECSILHEYDANKAKLGKKIRDAIDQKAIDKRKKKMNVMNGFLNNLRPGGVQLDSREENKSPLGGLGQLLGNKKVKEEVKAKEEEDTNTVDNMEKEVNELSADRPELEGGASDISGMVHELVDSEGEGEGEGDADEAEEYESFLVQYTNQSFMRDLINVLQFDLSEVTKNCPKLVERHFRIFDESLQRRVHIYEHLIHLAYGFCRPGFIKFITHDGLLNNKSLHRVSKPYAPGLNSFYDSCISFISAFQGDLENFSKYCKGLLDALGLEGNTDFPAREKAIKILMLIKGDSIGDEVEGISATNNSYQSIFQTLFGKQSNSAMYLHKLATMSEDDLVMLFTAKDSQVHSTQVQRAKKLSKLLIDDFLVRHLEMDTDSIEWLSALTRIAMGDYDGFDYVSKEYDISNTKSTIYKAICTRDYLNMDALFHAIDEEIPFELCTSISWILNGDIDSLRDLILYRLHIETQDTKVRITYDNVYKLELPERLEEEKQELGDYLKVLFSLIEGESFDIEDLKKIIGLCGIDENMAHILIGFNALLNKDFVHVHDIFEFQMFKDELDNMDLVHAVIKLASGKWTKESLKIVTESIIVTHNLYTDKNVHDQIERMSEKLEFETMINLIEATEGNMQSLGQMCDLIFFENKSWICTLLAITATGKFSMDTICSAESFALAKKKFVKDIKRLFECLFSVACDHPKLDDFIYQYDIPVLLFSLLCPNQELIHKFVNFKDSLRFLENDVIATLLTLASPQERVPTLFSAFRVAKPQLEKKFEVNIPMTNNEEYPLVIPNFEFEPNPIMEKMGTIYESLSFKKKGDNELMDVEKQQLYSTDYGYSIEQGGVKINVAKLFKLLFQTTYGDNTAMLIVMDMMTPLFRDITGGSATINIASVLAKGKKDKIFDHMTNLVRLIIIGMITEKLELKNKSNDEDDIEFSEDEIKKFSESFNFTDNLVRGVVCWIKGALLLLDKDAANIKIDRYRQEFFSMCDSLYAYEKEINREDVLVHDISKQTDLMISIVGMCKGSFRKIEIIGVQVG